MGYIYEYRIKGLQKVDAQIAGEICENLMTSEAGLTPASLLDVSRSESAPLHNEFEWDDTKAAEGYRLGQARGIIQNLKVTVTECGSEPIQSRAFVSVDRGTSEYIPINVVLEDEDMTEKMMRQAKADCKAFIDKYSQLEQLESITEQMRKFVDVS